MRHSEDNDPEPPDETFLGRDTKSLNITTNFNWYHVRNDPSLHVKLRGMTHRQNETATAQRTGVTTTQCDEPESRDVGCSVHANLFPELSTYGESTPTQLNPKQHRVDPLSFFR